MTIRARNITRSYASRVALDDFTLDVPEGAVFGLLGPNGSGKSTFITMLAAMDTPVSGSFAVFGETPAPALRARVGTVFQENTSDPLMTVDETLALAARLFNVDRRDASERFHLLLRAFGLVDRRFSGVATLSGGMRRRLEMVRALLHDPDLLLLDEPTTGVDVDERRKLWTALLDRTAGERTILLATNDLAEADAVCDRVAFIRDGAVVATGTPAELKQGLRREALRVTWDGVTDEQVAAISDRPGVGHVAVEGETVHISVDEASAIVPVLFELAPGQVRAVAIQPTTLEDAYLHHIGRTVDAPEQVPA